MTKEQIKELLIQAINEVQTMSGRPIKNILDDTKPIKDLYDFDSLNALEALSALEQKLNFEFYDDNIFISTDGNRALKISEIVDEIMQRLIKGSIV